MATPTQPTQMEINAAKAALNLPNLKTAQDVADWIRANFMDAGYKHLCRNLLIYFKPALKECPQCGNEIKGNLAVCSTCINEMANNT